MSGDASANAPTDTGNDQGTSQANADGQGNGADSLPADGDPQTNAAAHGASDPLDESLHIIHRETRQTASGLRRAQRHLDAATVANQRLEVQVDALRADPNETQRRLQAELDRNQRLEAEIAALRPHQEAAARRIRDAGENELTDEEARHDFQQLRCLAEQFTTEFCPPPASLSPRETWRRRAAVLAELFDLLNGGYLSWPLFFNPRANGLGEFEEDVVDAGIGKSELGLHLQNPCFGQSRYAKTDDVASKAQLADWRAKTLNLDFDLADRRGLNDRFSAHLNSVCDDVKELALRQNRALAYANPTVRNRFDTCAWTMCVDAMDLVLGMRACRTKVFSVDVCDPGTVITAQVEARAEPAFCDASQLPRTVHGWTVADTTFGGLSVEYFDDVGAPDSVHQGQSRGVRKRVLVRSQILAWPRMEAYRRPRL